MVGNEKGKENILFFFYDDSGYVDQLGHTALGQKKAGGALLERAARCIRFLFPSGELPQADMGFVCIGQGGQTSFRKAFPKAVFPQSPWSEGMERRMRYPP